VRSTREAALDHVQLVAAAGVPPDVKYVAVIIDLIPAPTRRDLYTLDPEEPVSPRRAGPVQRK
jgi:hypothetical protein